jgi:hypothetical protein
MLHRQPSTFVAAGRGQTNPTINTKYGWYRISTAQAASEEWALQLDGRDGSAELANSLQRPSFSAPARGKSLGLGSARSGMLQQARVRPQMLKPQTVSPCCITPIP